MTLSRRRFLRAITGFAVVLAIPAATGRAWQAANGTPWPEELRQGFVTGAERNFEATGMRPTGPSAIAVGAYVFDSSDAAREVFAGLADFYRARLDPGGALRPASAPELGDEVLAYAGDVQAEGRQSVAVGLLCWREAPVVYIAAAAGLTGDQLTPLFTIADNMAPGALWARRPGREISDAPVATPTGAQDMHTGGVWDLLPTLADLPEGFVFRSDEPIPTLPSAQRAPGLSATSALHGAELSKCENGGRALAECTATSAHRPSPRGHPGRQQS